MSDLMLTAVELGGPRLLVYPDGTVRFEHTCHRPGKGTFTTAPALRCGPHGPGHEVVSRDPWNIVPSVLCPDCGMHGFVTDGKWVTA